jgi:DNA repair protein RecN (Recombination protein N)
MLTELNVQNLATLTSVDLEFKDGLVAITGDTGAGKSLILDALELALGARADSGLVRSGTERAQITATFDISALPDARQWLIDNALEDEETVMLRRTITAEGRSKAFVNGTPLTNQQLKALSDQLVFMHTQHANQQLLQNKHQLMLVDAFADQGAARDVYQDLFTTWRDATDRLEQLRADAAHAEAERELLNFQVEELDQLNLGETEFAALDSEQRQLSSGEEFIRTVETALTQLTGADTDGLIAHAERIASDLERLSGAYPTLGNASGLMTEASIALTEARREVQTARDQIDLDPARLQFVEERLAQVFALARKHKIEPDDVVTHHRTLQARLDAIVDADTRIPELEAEVAAHRDALEQAAQRLTQVRAKAAHSLSSQISALLPDLGMPHATLNITLIEHAELTFGGAETVRFEFQPNPGQSGGALSKIASGGELSRVSLAIQVVSARQMATPTLVFDEVDVGIGGQTAAQVGQLLSDLASNAQALVVTHQPQVAGHAHAHLHVDKQSDADVTESRATFLTDEQRIAEIARMLGGHTITDTTLTAARELLVVSPQ